MGRDGKRGEGSKKSRKRAREDEEEDGYVEDFEQDDDSVQGK